MAGFMTIITFYALFGDDLRFIFLPNTVDDYWYGMTSFSCISFSLEIMVACYAKLEYPCSFFFWLDTVSTASMVFDIGWITAYFQAFAFGGQLADVT